MGLFLGGFFYRIQNVYTCECLVCIDSCLPLKEGLENLMYIFIPRVVRERERERETKTLSVGVKEWGITGTLLPS